ncbi:expressed unknown protein [Seminavis robusta]|uniref:Uncharacterized protein n=1 Tax=Seminavis robusta TaxID=568900 RepID=A0A9N8DX58_9STRA|nr:expressed unknown protein [Seminavis robusta]|eukprot:Sro433_g141760.1 n/a (582) ;mRNA; f:9557-11302
MVADLLTKTKKEKDHGTSLVDTAATSSMQWTTSTSNPDLPSQTMWAWQEMAEKSSLPLGRGEESGGNDDQQLLVSSKDYFLEHGFPRQWKPGSLERILHQKGNKKTGLTMAILGGSASARAANNCSSSTTFYTTNSNDDDDLYGGRYSNQLQERWNVMTASSTAQQSYPHLEVVNLAQGATDSVTNALMLDQLIDPRSTDVLLWEFHINDHHGSLEEQVRKLDFWLTRVRVLYHNQPPPPIVLLYLWEFQINAQNGKWIQRTNGTIINQRVVNSVIHNLLDTPSYSNWDIGVINVGAVINRTTIMAHSSRLFDDRHHPSCQAVGIIADMIQYFLVSNLLSSSLVRSNNDTTANDTTTGTTISSSITSFRGSAASTNIYTNTQSVLSPDIPLEWKELWTDLFDANTTVGSLSPWVPRGQFGNHTNSASSSVTTNLHIANRHDIDQQPLALEHRVDKRRADRKYGYKVFHCDATPSFRIKLLESRLKWIGLAFGTQAPVITINGIRLHNDNQTKASSTWNKAIVYVDRWINLWEILEIIRGKEDDHQCSFELSLCHDEERGSYKQLLQLIGVSIDGEHPHNLG